MGLVLHTQLGEERLSTALDGFGADAEAVGHLGRGEASTDQGEDLEFTLGEAVRYRGGPVRRQGGLRIDSSTSSLQRVHHHVARGAPGHAGDPFDQLAASMVRWIRPYQYRLIVGPPDALRQFDRTPRNGGGLEEHRVRER